MRAPDSATVAIVMAKLEYLRAENVSLLHALRVERANTAAAIQGMSERFAVLDDATDALRAKWESARQTMAEIVEHGCVLHTEDGLCCYYCEADAEYPDESGDYEHFELPHTTTCIWAKARAMLDANAPQEAIE